MENLIERLALELVKLGWDAKADGEFLSVAEAPALRSPSLRGGRYVWDGYSARKPETIAKRLDAFLREGGRLPGAKVAPDATIAPGAKVAPGATVGAGATVRPFAFVAPGATVAPGAKVARRA